MIQYIEALDSIFTSDQRESIYAQARMASAASISRSKRNRLVNQAVELINEMVIASAQTRSTLLECGAHNMLL